VKVIGQVGHFFLIRANFTLFTLVSVRGITFDLLKPVYSSNIWQSGRSWRGHGGEKYREGFPVPGD